MSKGAIICLLMPLKVSFAQMKFILALMEVYNETTIDTNEWIFSANEQQKV